MYRERAVRKRHNDRVESERDERRRVSWLVAQERKRRAEPNLNGLR
jgi:hypothetical protein